MRANALLALASLCLGSHPGARLLNSAHPAHLPALCAARTLQRHFEKFASERPPLAPPRDTSCPRRTHTAPPPSPLRPSASGAMVNESSSPMLTAASPPAAPTTHSTPPPTHAATDGGASKTAEAGGHEGLTTPQASIQPDTAPAEVAAHCQGMLERNKLRGADLPLSLPYSTTCVCPSHCGSPPVRIPARSPNRNRWRSC